MEEKEEREGRKKEKRDGKVIKGREGWEWEGRGERNVCGMKRLQQ